MRGGFGHVSMMLAVSRRGLRRCACLCGVMLRRRCESGAGCKRERAKSGGNHGKFGHGFKPIQKAEISLGGRKDTRRFGRNCAFSR